MISDPARSPEHIEPTASSAAASGYAVRLPLAQPRIVYVILATIAVAFVVQTVAGGSTNNTALVRMGAQLNSNVAEGEVWRLLAAMFLHIGLQHIAFNAWAVFSIGRDIEAFYGPVWFTAIYLLSGLAGNIAFYVLGDNILSAGASGAVFGLIGAEGAYLLRNRKLFGAMGRQRLGNILVLVAINLVFGFTVPGINNLAHLGGLVCGLGLGWLLAPTYQPVFALTDGEPRARLVDRKSPVLRLFGVLLVIVLLFGGYLIGTDRWGGDPTLLRSRALEAYMAGDLATAEQLIQQAAESAPNDETNWYLLGAIFAEQGRLAEAVGPAEKAYHLAPDDADMLYLLGAVYAELDRDAEARPLLNRLLEIEPAGQQADNARLILQSLR